LTEKIEIKVEKIEEENKPRRLVFKSLRVPYYIHEKVKDLSQRYGKKMYTIVEEALATYVNYLKKPYRKSELPKLDKCSWYVYKLGRSVGAFKENPTEENARKLLNTLEQIEERIGVSTAMLRGIVEKLVSRKNIRIDTDTSIEINDTTKLIISDIIYKMLFEEEEQ